MKPFEQNIRVLLHETFLHRRFFAAAFILIVAVGLMVGAFWPKTYTASSSILLEEKNIIQPLMLGAAVPTEIADKAKLAREVIFSNKVMNKVLEHGGWLAGNPSPEEREDLIARIKRQTKVTSVSTNLVKIEYQDTDPERAYQVTKKFTELFVAESLGTKVQESESAFHFIDAQVKEYQAKLYAGEEKIKQFRATGLEGTRDRDGRRGDSLPVRIEQTRMELQEAETRYQSLEKQLAQELQSASVYSREREYQDRLNAAQSQLAALRLQYRDTYPDIVRLKSEVQELEQSIAAERKRNPERAAMSEASTSAIHQQLRQDLGATKTRMDTLNARLVTLQRQANESDAVRRQGGTTLAELIRNNEVTQATLDDLLKRRETARVSMNLDRQKQGLSLRVTDEPVVPMRPSGPGFPLFALGALAAGLLLPLMLIYGRNQIDGRVRSGSTLAEKLNLPVVAVVPHLATPKEAVAASRSLHWLSILVLSVVFIVISIIWTGNSL